MFRAEDGNQVCQFPLGGRLLLFTDDGVAYLASTELGQKWVAAVDTVAGGRELWRTEGVGAHTAALDGSHLYYVDSHYDLRVPRQPVALAEVGALDAQTGRQLWSWHSPQDTSELLRLWGARTPGMLADSAQKSWETIMTVLTSYASHGSLWSRRHPLLRELRTEEERRFLPGPLVDRERS